MPTPAPAADLEREMNEVWAHLATLRPLAESVFVERNPAPGTGRVLMKFTPDVRTPWRLNTVIAEDRITVPSPFLVFRPKEGGPSPRVLWALLSSPVANAYAYCSSSEQETLPEHWRTFPLPRMTQDATAGIEAAASVYLTTVAASNGALPSDADARVKQALLKLDAEVLKLYDFPPRLEHQLLDLFTGVERKGVGCEFRGYYPAGFTSFLPLHLVISERFKQAAADLTADRFKPGESDYVRDVLAAAAAGADEE